MQKLAALRKKDNTVSNAIHSGLVLGGAGLGAYAVKTYKDADKDRKWSEHRVDLHKQVYDFHKKRVEELRQKKSEIHEEWKKLFDEFSDTLDKKWEAKKKFNKITDEVIKADPSKKMDKLLYETQYKLHQATLDGLEKRLDSLQGQIDEYAGMIEEHKDKADKARRTINMANSELETKLLKLRKAKALGALGAGLGIYGTYKLIKDNM